MTKIQIDDGKTEEKKSTSPKKAVRKIIVTDGKEGISSAATHTTVQKSTTLSRKYVKKPVRVTTPAKATPAKTTAIKKATTARAAAKALAKAEAKKAAEKKAAEKRAELKKREEAKRAEAAKRAAEKKQRAASKLTEKRLRAEREQVAKAAKIAKAKAEKEAKLARATAAKLAKKQTTQKRTTGEKLVPKMPKMGKSAKKEDRALKSATVVIENMAKEEKAEKASIPKMEHAFKKKHKAHHVFFALLCSGATVAALVAFVHFSIPDLSVRVAAFQTGIDATYPTFTPRGYNLSGVTSDKDGIVTITFAGPDGASFTLSEEKSTWDSTALLNNYVKKNYPNDFTTLREQGITIYVRGEKAGWVNGGVLYKVEATGKYLTKEQIRNIATSL